MNENQKRHAVKRIEAARDIALKKAKTIYDDWNRPDQMVPIFLGKTRIEALLVELRAEPSLRIVELDKDGLKIAHPLLHKLFLELAEESDALFADHMEKGRILIRDIQKTADKLIDKIILDGTGSAELDKTIASLLEMVPEA